MDPLHATIEEFAADGYTHVECFCPRCRVIRLRANELASQRQLFRPLKQERPQQHAAAFREPITSYQ